MNKFIRMTLVLTIGLSFFLCVKAQNTDNERVFYLSPIPYAFNAYNSPIDIGIEDNSIVEFSSKAKTNLFNGPNGVYSVQTAPMMLFHPDSNFVFKVKVTADFKEVYDVAALVLYQDNNLWAKLCFENSINKEATIVSVVTNKFSDDCNSIEVKDKSAYLLIAKKGNEISFHCSNDNVHWNLVRHFRMEFDKMKLRVGFTVHCSRGECFSARFSGIGYNTHLPTSMRVYK